MIARKLWGEKMSSEIDIFYRIEPRDNIDVNESITLQFLLTENIFLILKIQVCAKIETSQMFLCTEPY